MAIMRVLESSLGVNIDSYIPIALDQGDVTRRDSRRVDFTFEQISDILGGDFVFDTSGHLQSGEVRTLNEYNRNGPVLYIYNFTITVSQINEWVLTGDWAAAKRAALAGDDDIGGSSFADVLRGYEGADTIAGGGGNDFIDGGIGTSYLRGDDGADTITGGAVFDDINGNMGDDSCAGGAGNDWVVGGKDQDKLFGDAGDDIVYGNLGDDSCAGGDGNDLVRGGQQNDNLTGGAGNDWLSGDRDSDTISGGAGADTFHSFGDAGLDRVTDFNRAEGDRVQLDPGSTYTVAQQGADVVIAIAGGAQMVLVGVQLSSLTGDWIFVG